MSKTVHDFVLEGLRGGQVNFNNFKGKKILIVNVASACGYTPQYKQLQELYEHNADKLVVVGVPCNDFGAQEPGTADEIASFCDLNFGVTFPLTQKLTILGEQRHPLYSFLTKKEINNVADSEVQWNFQKYLLDEHGQLIKVYSSAIEPLSDEILNEL